LALVVKQSASYIANEVFLKSDLFNGWSYLHTKSMYWGAQGELSVAFDVPEHLYMACARRAAGSPSCLLESVINGKDRFHEKENKKREHVPLLPMVQLLSL